jgi:hypothetical protein
MSTKLHHGWMINVIKMYFKMLTRYQYITYYIVAAPILLLTTRLLNLAHLDNHIIVFMTTNFILWIFSPFIVNQLSLCQEDFKALIFFPLKWYQFLLARNILLYLILFLTYLLSFILIELLYGSIFTFPVNIIVFITVFIIPIVSISNLLIITYFYGKRRFLFFCNVLIIILSTNLNLGIFIMGENIFDRFIFYLLIFLLTQIYLILYKISLNRTVKRIKKDYGKCSWMTTY